MAGRWIAALLRWHMRLGAVVSVAIIAWGLSGLAHPIISRLQPMPEQQRFPLQAMASEQLLSPAAALAAAGLGGELRALRLVNWGQGAQYRAEIGGAVRWLDARSGARLAAAERDYAEVLARHFSGDSHSAIAERRRQSHFDDDYLFINRLLPVQRVALARDDGLRVYVDTASGRLASLVNDRKALGSSLFRQLHSWLFIANEGLRHALMLGFLAGGLLVGVAGIVQYLLQARSGRPWRRGSAGRNWHRRLGIAVSLTVITFSVSGGWHLLQKHNGAPPRAPEPLAVAAETLTIDWSALGGSIMQAELVSVGGEPAFRLWQGGELSYRHGATGALLAGGEREHARQLAAYYAGHRELGEPQLVDRFGGEYGFINKRLPVVAVDSLIDSSRYYVEPRSGVLAALVRDSDRAEGWSFAWLHKWQFLDGLGRNARDAIAALFALGITLSFALGLWLYARRQWRRYGPRR